MPGLRTPPLVTDIFIDNDTEPVTSTRMFNDSVRRSPNLHVQLHNEDSVMIWLFGEYFKNVNNNSKQIPSSSFKDV